MTGHLATAPSEREAFRRSGVRVVGVDEAATGSDPAVVRRSFCALDEASYHLDSAAEPWTVHLEVRLSGSVVEDRLRRAVRVALGRQPELAPGWQPAAGVELSGRSPPDLTSTRSTSSGVLTTTPCRPPGPNCRA